MKNKITLTFLLTLALTLVSAQKNKLTNTDTTTVVFTVCFGTYSDSLFVKQDKFREVSEISFYWDSLNKIYRYTSGRFMNVESAVARKKFLKEKGFVDAYVMALKNGKRISINDAIKKQ